MTGAPAPIASGVTRCRITNLIQRAGRYRPVWSGIKIVHARIAMIANRIQMKTQALLISLFLLSAVIICCWITGCAEPNPDSPTGSEDPIYSGPATPGWHHPDSLCYFCHEGIHSGNWSAPENCLLCHEVPPGPSIPGIPHGDRPDYSCIEQGCHEGVHGGAHTEDQCLACHSF